MKKLAFAALGLLTIAPIAHAQQPTNCPALAPKDAGGIVYSYNGGLGKRFALQLSRGIPSDKNINHVSCSSQDTEAKNVDCAIKGFSGVMHIYADGTDSYFKIASSPDIQVTVRAGHPMKCTLQAAATSN